MMPERMQQIQKLYQLACERPAGERDSFIRTVCGGDPELLGAGDGFPELRYGRGHAQGGGTNGPGFRTI